MLGRGDGVTAEPFKKWTPRRAIVYHAAIVAVDRVASDVAALEARLDFFVFIVRGRARGVEQQVDQGLIRT